MTEDRKGLGSAGSASKRKMTRYVLLLVIVFAVLEVFILAYRPPKDALLVEPEVSYLRDDSMLGRQNLPLLLSSGGDPHFISGMYSFELRLFLPENMKDSARKVLVFPQISGSSLEVFIDGEKLGSRGDPAAGQSSIWNSIHQFCLPEGLSAGLHYLEARIQGTYEAGIVTIPYVVDADSNSLRLFLLDFFTNYSIWLSIGCILIVSLIVLSMGFFNEKSRTANLLLGLAGLAVSVFLTDFVYIERLPMSLVAFKKLVVALRHFSVACFTIAYLRLLGKGLSLAAKAFVALQLACFVLVIVYPGDIVAIKRLYSITFLGFIPSLLYLLYKVIRHTAETGDLSILLFGILVVFLSAGRDIVVMVILRPEGFILISHYGFIVLALSSCAFVVNDSLRQYKNLAFERDRAAAFREESLRDELTGCYNRKLLPFVTDNLAKPYSLLVFDIDDFKRINDRFGHETGDAVLKELVHMAGRNIRSHDYIVRTGGDEFLIILRSCPLKIACSLAERLVAEASSFVMPLPPGRVGEGAVGAASRDDTDSMLHFTVSMGIASCAGERESTQEEFASTLRSADAEMYRAKNQGKNRWCAVDPKDRPSLVQNGA
jgi:diguanylate cyclase (GGDEF)-like protein